MDCSPPGSPVPGILQARVLEWGATAFSNDRDLALYNRVRNSSKHGCKEKAMPGAVRKASHLKGLAYGSRQRNEDLCVSPLTLAYM